ncbi:MAG: sterol desaturase family protein [Pseudomonadota bacterium]
MVSVYILPGAIVAMLLWELVSPRTGARPERVKRWLANGALGIAAYVLGRSLVGAGLVGLALWSEQRGIGMLHLVDLPVWVEMALAIVLLDFVIWAQHAAFHAIPFLWPLHRVHHCDEALDVSTAWRFHPGEIILSLGVKALAVIAIGPSPLAIVAFALLLAISAMFNHAHIRLPVWLDRSLSLLIVTPDAHRVHHGLESGFDRTNYGFFLNLWDRAAGCYKRLPPAQTDALTLGSEGYAPDQSLARLLTQPFRGPSQS